MPDTRTFGDSSWDLRAEPDARPTLVVAHHADLDRVGERLAVPEGAGRVLGRGADGGGLLDDARVSTRHARVRRQGDAVTVEDLGSRNSTRVNGRRVEQAVLAEGDTLALGELLFVLRTEPPRLDAPRRGGLLGISAALDRVLRQVDAVAAQDTPVLLLGEPGVGKDLVAREIHARSGRRGDYVAVNCGAVADQLLQSELFGHERGAFSGAGRPRPGLVATAEQGTLLLDEIGEASAAFQVALLRLLENGEYRPVGSDRVRQAGVRVVAATNRDLGGDGFRPDLRDRLSRWVIAVPSLRERSEDVPLLATHFARRRAGRSVRLDRRLALLLTIHPWPGNVRELANVVERLTVESAEGDLLRPTPWLAERLADATPPAPPAEPRGRPSAEELTRRLGRCGGNMKALAQELGVGRTTLYRWLGELGLRPADLRGSPGDEP